MVAAAGWLDRELGAQREAHERSLLVVDEFDPHEPFDVPAPWVGRYDDPSDVRDEPRLIWPPYARSAEESGLDARQARLLRAAYGAKVSMIDAWLGRLVATMDRLGCWDDTALVVCTDHGHFLGEKGIWGKPAVPLYEPMAHLPLLVVWPGLPERAGGTVDALTTTVDLHATIADVFAVSDSVEHRTHGTSLLPLLTGEASTVREWALAGVWGREVQVVGDGGALRFTRAPAARNAPLTMWSNRWSTMPIHAFPEVRLPRPDRRAGLAFMPGSDVPVIRQPFDESDHLPFWATRRFSGDHLYDVHEDPDEEHDLSGGPRQGDALELLRAALAAVDAPDEQLVRLGLR
jgi:hypothetical protein